MGKLLKVLTVILLVLSVLALVFGMQLFKKREIQKGRLNKFETALIKLASSVERADAEENAAAPSTFPARDTSDCTDSELENPNKSEFWKNYQSAMEKQGRATMNIADRRFELQSYYKVDMMGKIETDPAGMPMTTGKGTMDEILNEVLGNAEKQLENLNKARQQLTILRTELVDTITELNTRKTSLRKALSEIKGLNERISDLEGQVRQKEEQVAAVIAEKQALEEQIAAKDQQIAKLTEQAQMQEDEIKSQQKTIKELRGQMSQSAASAMAAISVKLDAGVKGKVVSVNPEWNFAVLELDAACLKQLLGSDLSGDMPMAELMVRRTGSNGAFVAKVRLNKMNREEKLVIADILTDWQQMPVAEGDIVFF